MIRFPCNCGNEIAVRESMAGDVTQCGRCGRLLDVPYLEDLDKIDKDGSFKMSEDNPHAKATLNELPGRGVVLNYASDKKNRSPDRRNTLEQFMAVGVPAESLGPKRTKPKYDPETGERVVPLDVATKGIDAQAVTPIDEPDAPETPAPTKGRTLRYADRATQSRTSLTRLPLELFMAHNAFVIMILFAGHVLLSLYLALPLVFMLFLSLAGAILLLGVIGHYGNVIEDTGPEERDEVPTLFRHASFGEDIWLPFVRVTVALFVCFWPIIAVQAVVLYERALGISAALGGRPAPASILTDTVVYVALGLSAAMFFALPAVLLITCTSGSMVNLAPQRILRTIWGGGLGYIWCLVLFALAMTTTLAAAGTFRAALLLAFDQIDPLPLPTWAVVLIGTTSTLIGVYLLHLACFSLGLVYRKHHADFRWVHQYFEKDERDDAMSKLEKFHKRQRAKARRARIDHDQRDERQLAALRK